MVAPVLVAGSAAAFVVAVLVAAIIIVAARARAQRRAARALAITSDDGIVGEEYVALGGIEQWISIRGESRSNPVLLIVHGGPGAPGSSFTARLRAWERHFTVVRWDQRGAGKTFGRNRRAADAGAARLAQLASDGIALTELVCARLGQPKIVLVAASAGSSVGLEMARRRPELFHALVATDLNVDAPLKAHDARRAGRRFAVPFFLFQGDRDLRTRTMLAEGFFAEVQAPHKEAALIGGAGRLAPFGAPEAFLRELVTRVRPWAVRAVAETAAPPRRQWHLWVAGRRI